MEWFSIELIINILAGLGLLTYWLIAFVILYHLSRFGIGTQPKKLAAIFILGSVALSGVAVALFVNVDFNPLISYITLR